MFLRISKYFLIPFWQQHLIVFLLYLTCIKLGFIYKNFNLLECSNINFSTFLEDNSNPNRYTEDSLSENAETTILTNLSENENEDVMSQEATIIISDESQFYSPESEEDIRSDTEKEKINDISFRPTAPAEEIKDTSDNFGRALTRENISSKSAETNAISKDNTPLIDMNSVITEQPRSSGNDLEELTSGFNSELKNEGSNNFENKTSNNSGCFCPSNCCNGDEASVSNERGNRKEMHFAASAKVT